MAGNCCLNLHVLKTRPGIFKLLELVFASLITTFLNQCVGVSTIVGVVHSSFRAFVSSCVFTGSLLIVSYVLSSRSFNLIRSSLFEVLFNGIASFLFLSHSLWLLIKAIFLLWPIHLLLPFASDFPLVMAAVTLGFCLFLIHAIDGFFSYQQQS